MRWSTGLGEVAAGRAAGGGSWHAVGPARGSRERGKTSRVTVLTAQWGRPPRSSPSSASFTCGASTRSCTGLPSASSTT